ncbi:MAG TPA: hypothetical protein VMT32_05975 [Bryobacteraceae bacterium]|nr:hypothetical protein [Bryobacteraceae bacterium]
MTTRKTGLDALDYETGGGDPQDENARLRAQLEERKQGGDELAEAFERAQERIAELENAGHRHEPKDIPDNPWELPRVNLLLFGAVIAGWLVVGARLFEGSRTLVTAAWALAFGALALWRFVIWTRVQYRQDGLGPLLIKWIILAAGLWVVIATGADYGTPAIVSFLALAATMLLALSRLAEWISETTTEMGWF